MLSLIILTSYFIHEEKIIKIKFLTDVFIKSSDDFELPVTVSYAKIVVVSLF
jgi:hypothetical protein